MENFLCNIDGIISEIKYNAKDLKNGYTKDKYFYLIKKTDLFNNVTLNQLSFILNDLKWKNKLRLD